MKNECPKCGHSMDHSEEEDFKLDAMSMDEERSDDDEASMKDELLTELIEVMQGSLGSKLKSKKPEAMSVEIMSAKPLADAAEEDDEEEEDEDY